MMSMRRVNVAGKVGSGPQGAASALKNPGAEVDEENAGDCE
jgi:hypothetical protein